MATITSRLKDGSIPSDKVMARIKEAASYPVAFDEDCPELTDEQLIEFKRGLRCQTTIGTFASGHSAELNGHS